MALKVHCSFEPGWFPHLEFREVAGELVHWVEPSHFAGNGQLLNVRIHGAERVAAAEHLRLSEADARSLTRLFRDEP
jgi:hypothetical protein